MSQENVELARRHYAILNAAFESGDLRALERHNAEFLDPDFVCKPAPVFDDTEEMHGQEGALRYTRTLMEPFDAVWVQPQKFIESEARLVVPIRFRGRARYTGIDVDLDRWHVWTFRSGTVLRLDIYVRKSEALDAAGLRE